MRLPSEWPPAGRSPPGPRAVKRQARCRWHNLRVHQIIIVGSTTRRRQRIGHPAGADYCSATPDGAASLARVRNGTHAPLALPNNGNARDCIRVPSISKRTPPHRKLLRSAVIPPRPGPGRPTRYRCALDSRSCNRCNKSSRIGAGGRRRRRSVRRRSANRSARRRRMPARSARRRCD